MNINPVSFNSNLFIQKLKQVNKPLFFWPDRQLVQQLKTIDAVELKKLLNQFLAEAVRDHQIGDPVRFLDRLAQILPLEKIAVGDALKEAKMLFEEAKLYLDSMAPHPSPTIRERLSAILEGLMAVLDSLITVFGITEFFKPAQNEMHAGEKAQKIFMLVSLFSMVTGVLLPTLGAATGGAIIGGIFLTFTALSLIWPKIKPLPKALPVNAENWTEEVRRGKCFAEGRKEALDQVANILKAKRHVLLVGPSRVGKSLTVKAFARAIERGEYPELKGKLVFRLNTTDLIGYKPSLLGGNKGEILDKISASMGRHRNDIILVLDEGHMACKNGETLADKLKTLVEEGGEFPAVILITTDEEYKHVKENNAFSLRFDKVDIKSTSREETLSILALNLLRMPSKPLIEAGAHRFTHLRWGALRL